MPIEDGLKFAGLGQLNSRRTASDEVADALREAIVSGRFADGEELNQVALAEHFGVSRVPIREALRRLQAEGLINMQAHRKVTVIGQSRARISENLEIRARLEGYMLERAAKNFTADDFEALNQLCDRMERTSDHATWLKLNREFHQKLLEPSNATIAMSIVNQLNGQVERYVRGAASERPARVAEEHRELVQLLEKKQVRKAVSLLRKHIEGTSERVLASLDQAA